jgi:hypothetical protein
MKTLNDMNEKIEESINKLWSLIVDLRYLILAAAVIGSVMAMIATSP